jgi:PKD repeat protein
VPAANASAAATTPEVPTTGETTAAGSTPAVSDTGTTQGAAVSTTVTGTAPAGGGTGAAGETQTAIVTTTAATTSTVTATPTQDCKGDFVGSPRSGTAPLTVTFTSLTPCDVVTRTWKFGDGTVIEKTGQKTETHTYTQPGSYRVELLEVNPPHGYSADRTDYITVTAASSAGSTPTPGVAVKPPTDLKVNPSLFITETPTARSSLAVSRPTNLQVNPDLIVTPKITLVANVPNMPANPQI